MTEPARILVVDDDDVFRKLLAKELAQRGFVPTEAASVQSARKALGHQKFHVALIDLRLPDGDGLEIVRTIGRETPSTVTIVLTGHGTVDTAIAALRSGAHDYLRKPCPNEELEVTIQKALEHQALVEKNTILRDGFSTVDVGADFVGRSAAFQELCGMVDRVAATGSSVLLLGETGAGKDVVARLIHSRSGRRDQPFVVVECAALQEDLLQSELFGHEKGAFTGAMQPKHGLFEVAHKGTMFLDEIGDVSLATQVKLLRVLETGKFRHVGGTEETVVDVRIVVATNRDLAGLMERGYFRSDLYYRLNTITIEIPALRQRQDDIAVIAEHFLKRLNSRFGQNKRYSRAALEALCRYGWPGNVRELLHVVERAVILCDGDTVKPEHLPQEAQILTGAADRGFLPLCEMERQHIERVLSHVAGSRSRAAEILGISERTLYRKLREYGLNP